MIVVLSYLLAILITLAVAVLLYPVAAVFWFLGLFGRISDNLFVFTRRIISSLWKDIRDIHQSDKPGEGNEINKENKWTCSCGAVNVGKFCSECGKSKPLPETEKKNDTDE